jgi:hypothetical protein
MRPAARRIRLAFAPSAPNQLVSVEIVALVHPSRADTAARVARAITSGATPAPDARDNLPKRRVRQVVFGEL